MISIAPKSRKPSPNPTGKPWGESSREFETCPVPGLLPVSTHSTDETEAMASPDGPCRERHGGTVHTREYPLAFSLWTAEYLSRLSAFLSHGHPTTTDGPLGVPLHVYIYHTFFFVLSLMDSQNMLSVSSMALTALEKALRLGAESNSQCIAVRILGI